MFRPAPAFRAGLILGTGLLLSGCRGLINGAIKGDVMPDAMAWQDLEMSCSFGQTAAGALDTLGKKRAEVAMILGWVPAGVCAELEAWEGMRTEALIMKTHGGDAEGRVAAATDAAYKAQRSFALAAQRYDTGWFYWETRYGDVEDCSKLSDKEQQVYLLGVLSGALSVVNDAKAKQQAIGVPQNRLLEAARRSECLDDARFFYIPQAVRGAAWATIPGSGPEGSDPWALITEAAAKGDAAGQSIPRALMAFTAANAGNTEVLEAAILGFDGLAVATNTEGELTEWALMDTYGRRLSLYQSDLVWIRAKGHRSPRLGVLPVAPASSEDPFGGADPFGGSDPFAGGGESPDGVDAPAGDDAAGASGSSADPSSTTPQTP